MYIYIQYIYAKVLHICLFIWVGYEISDGVFCDVMSDLVRSLFRFIFTMPRVNYMYEYDKESSCCKRDVGILLQIIFKP